MAESITNSPNPRKSAVLKLEN